MTAPHAPHVALVVDWRADVVPELPKGGSDLPDWEHLDRDGALACGYIATADGDITWHGTLGPATPRAALEAILDHGLTTGALVAKPERPIVDLLVVNRVSTRRSAVSRTS